MNPFSSIFGSDVGQFLNAALLICFFWIALVHPEKVRKPIILRMARWLFALSIVLPAMAKLFVSDLSLGAKTSGVTQAILAQLAIILSPVCFIFAFILAVEAISLKSFKPEL